MYDAMRDCVILSNALVTEHLRHGGSQPEERLATAAAAVSVSASSGSAALRIASMVIGPSVSAPSPPTTVARSVSPRHAQRPDAKNKPCPSAVLQRSASGHPHNKPDEVLRWMEAFSCAAASLAAMRPSAVACAGSSNHARPDPGAARSIPVTTTVAACRSCPSSLVAVP